jgi:hypothetical protein
MEAKLAEALWAYRTAYETPIGMSSYQLIYGKTCHPHIKLEHRAHWAIQRWNMDLNQAREHRKLQISELEECRNKPYHSASIYKERTKRWHDRRLKLKVFNLGDKIMLFNSKVKLFGHGKLRSKCLGPYLIVDTSAHGAITIQDEGNLH